MIPTVSSRSLYTRVLFHIPENGNRQFTYSAVYLQHQTGYSPFINVSLCIDGKQRLTNYRTVGFNIQPFGAPYYIFAKRFR